MIRSIKLYKLWFSINPSNNASRIEWKLIIQLAQPFLNDFTTQQIIDKYKNITYDQIKSYEDLIEEEDRKNLNSTPFKVLELFHNIDPDEESSSQEMFDNKLNSFDLAFLEGNVFVPSKYPTIAEQAKIKLLLILFF